MSTPRFIKSGEGKDILSKEEIYHIQKVLRLKTKDKIVIFNGMGEEMLIEILKFKPYFEYSILEQKITEKKLPYIKLFLATIKSKNLELILEKVTELGVDEIVITKTKYSQINLNVLKEKQARLEKILIEACKQSGNNYVPKLNFIDINDIKNNLVDKNYIATTQYTENPDYLNIILKKTKEESYSLLIGPEGGFELQEYQNLINFFTPVTFSNNILRVETASILGIGILTQAKL